MLLLMDVSEDPASSISSITDKHNRAEPILPFMLLLAITHNRYFAVMV
jgi:hypothetical protein